MTYSAYRAMGLTYAAAVLLLLFLKGILIGGMSSPANIAETNNETTTALVPLYVAGLFGFAGPWPSGAAFLPAVQMGIEAINNREDVLPGYNLTMVWGDTQCNPGVGVDQMFRFLYQGPPKAMIIGAGCSTVTEATAQASHLWGVIQLSYVSSSPSLSDKTRFPRFFRVAAPDMLVNPTRVAMFQQFGWTKVATIHQSVELFSKVTEDLVKRLTDNNITLLTSEIFSDDPATQIRNLKEHDARIIVGGFHLDLLGKVFCEAYKAGLYGPQYVWVLVGWYDDGWWSQPSGDCTAEEVTTAAQGHFGTGFVNINPKQERGLSGLTSREWKAAYDWLIGYRDVVGIQEASQGYDTIWAAALALNLTLTELEETGSTQRLEDFSYSDANMTDMLLRNMWRVSFMGVKGQVEFDENGDTPGVVKIRRLQRGRREVVGYHSPGEGSTIEWLEETPILWPNGAPPRDSVTVVRRSMFVPAPLYITMVTLAGVGLGLAVLLLTLNVIYRKKRIIKMSSPALNNVIAVGCIVSYVTVFFQELDVEWVLFDCKARSVTLSIGFSLSFGALFTKTWRVYKIFTNTTKRTVLLDSQLYRMIAALVLVDVVLITGRELLDPQVVVAEVVEMEEESGGDVIVEREVHTCTSTYSLYYLTTVYAVKGLLLVFGAFLAIQTRKVHIQGLNDSQYIGLCIYNVVVLSVLGVVLSAGLTHQVALRYGCISSLLMFGTTSTLLIIAVPKMVALKNSMNQVQEETQATETEVTTTKTRPLSPTTAPRQRDVGVMTDAE